MSEKFIRFNFNFFLIKFKFKFRFYFTLFFFKNFKNQIKSWFWFGSPKVPQEKPKSLEVNLFYFARSFLPQKLSRLRWQATLYLCKRLDSMFNEYRHYHKDGAHQRHSPRRRFLQRAFAGSRSSHGFRSVEKNHKPWSGAESMRLMEFKG